MQAGRLVTKLARGGDAPRGVETGEERIHAGGDEGLAISLGKASIDELQA